MTPRPKTSFECRPLFTSGWRLASGGIGLVHRLVQELDLAAEIDRRAPLFKLYPPYHESEHVLSLADNARCAGTRLPDLELRRQDEAYLSLLGAQRIPDPTTAGDFCRRFTRESLDARPAAFDVGRRKIWSRQSEDFCAEARSPWSTCSRTKPTC